MPEPESFQEQTGASHRSEHEAATLPMSAPAPEELPCTGVPGYALLGELGRGGMGVVYKALHLHLNRTVALKMILAGSHAGPEELVRFRQEAAIVARLQHPNIVQIYEIGTHGGLSYLALEYVEGGSLARKAAGSPQPPRDAAVLVELIARAVDHAHHNGVIHRDLTPGNVLLTATGAPKLSDFGLARENRAVAGLTATGAIIGTPGFMAPEQATGDTAALSPRTDVFGLGAILYYLLTGRPPFQAATILEAVLKTIHDDPTHPCQVRPEVPRDLATICLKCLRKDLLQRYPTAAELADDLCRFLADEPIQARPVGRLERLGRWARRNPGWAVAAGAVALLLLTLAVGGTLAAALLKAERDSAINSKEWAESAERKARLQAFEALVSQAKAGRFSRRVGQRFDTLRAVREAAALLPALDLGEEKMQARRDELRDLAIAALALSDLRQAADIPWPEGSVGFDVDLARGVYVRSDNQGNVFRVRLRDGVETARLSGLGHNVGVVCYANGSVRLEEDVGDGHRRMRDWDPVTGQTTVRGERVPMWNRQVTSLDGRRMALLWSAGPTLKVYDLPAFREVQTFALAVKAPHWADLARVGLSPDGKRLAYVEGVYGAASQQVVRLYDVDTGKHLDDLTHNNGISSLVWLADGRTLATGCIDTNEVRLWDVSVRPARVVQLWTRQKGGCPWLTTNHTGELLASTAVWSGGLRLWQPRTGQELLHFPGTGLHLAGTSTDGRLWGVLHEKRRKVVWEAVAGREYATLARAPGFPPADFRNLSISPDGRLIAAGVEGGVALWDSSSGEERAFLRLGGKGSPWFALHSDDLFTNSAAGLSRWPRQSLGADHVQFGLPEPWTKRGHFQCSISGSLDGRLIAASGWPYSLKSLAFEQGPPRRVLPFGPHVDCRHLTVSPDGRYIATAGHYGGIKVWESASDQLVREWKGGDMCSATFSADGRWLLTFVHNGDEQTDGCRLWEVGTWQPLWSGKPNGAAPAAIAPNCQLLATSEAEGRLCLLDPSTGRTLARLEDPNQGRSNFLTFSPDSGKIIVTSNHNQTLHVWDLRAIRQQLLELGLDWEGAPLPPPQLPAAVRQITTVGMK